MADPSFRAEQRAERYAPHIEPINRYVDDLREVGRGFVPYVAPMHGGVDARVLSILRDPGPGTHDNAGSGFLCTENDDGSAELQAQLLDAVGLSPAELLPWNAYPWYINKKPNVAQLDLGVATILHLLDLAPRVTVVFLQGGDAAHAWRRLRRIRPDIEATRGLRVIESLHPSQQALFTPDPVERARRIARREEAFREVAALLA